MATAESDLPMTEQEIKFREEHPIKSCINDILCPTVAAILLLGVPISLFFAAHWFSNVLHSILK